MATKPKAAKTAVQGEVASAGRPTSYRPEFAEQAYKLCLLGATDAKLADFFNVAESTVNLWKQAQPDFSESITRGKDLADAEIAHSLFHRAKGYSHKAEKIMVVNQTVQREEYIEHYPPDTPAASLWLRNRQPGKWRDKVDIEATGANGGPIEHSMKIQFVPAQKPAAE